MPLQRWTRVIVAAGLALGVFGSFTSAQAAEPNPAIDQRAARILKAALQDVAAAKSFSFEAEIVRDFPLDSGQRIQNIDLLEVFVRRPDRLAAIRRGAAVSDGNMFYDGKTFTLYRVQENVYATWEAPATLDTLFDTMKEKIGFVPPLSALLHEDAGAADLRQNVLAATYVGRATIRGVDCHHLAFVGKNVDFQAWVAEGVPVIQRLVVTYKNAPMRPQYTATFLNWDFGAHLTDYLFAFYPPPGARKIEFKVVGKP